MKRNTTKGYLQSDRIVVRQWQRSDDALQRNWQQYTEPFSELWNLPGPWNLPSEIVATFVPFIETKRVWAVENHSGALIGRISLREMERWRGRARLGIMMNSAFVGQKLGTEALALFFDYFFGPLGFGMMRLDVAAVNRRAVRCYERLGFSIVGYEWRRSGMLLNLDLLKEPEYEHLAQFFRRDLYGIAVQYLEMQLLKKTWETYRSNSIAPLLSLPC